MIERSLREGTAMQPIPVLPIAATIPGTPTTTAPAVQHPTLTPAPTLTTPHMTAAPATHSDGMTDLIKMFGDLALAIKAQPAVAPSAAPVSAPTLASGNRPFSRPPRCIWYDSLDHSRNNCEDYNTALRNRIIWKNEEGRLINAATGKELPTMFGRGGMRILVGTTPTSQAAVTNVTSACNITLDQSARLDGNSILRTHVDFVTGERFEEIVEVDVEEKRKREGLIGGKNARPKRTHLPPVTVEEIPDEDMTDRTLGRT